MEIRTIITNLLTEKKAKNQAYSLRALARDLRIDVGQLHRIVTAKMEPSPLVAFRLGKHLNLDSDEIVRLIEMTIDK